LNTIRRVQGDSISARCVGKCKLYRNLDCGRRLLPRCWKGQGIKYISMWHAPACLAQL